MDTSRLLGVTIATSIVGLALLGAYPRDQQDWNQSMGKTPPPAQGGEWIDELDNSGKLSSANSTEVYGSHLLLKLAEYLNWKQTYTAHFALGDFFHTEAISDSVRLALADGSNQYFTTGTYTSTVFDAGRPVDWSSADWSHSGTFYAVTLQYRTGDTPAPNSTWTTWVTPTIRIGQFSCSNSVSLNLTNCNSNMSGIESSRYIQYRATFTSSDPNSSIAFYDINLVFGIHPLTGTATSQLISPVDLLSWRESFYTSTIPVSTSLTIDVLSSDGNVLLSNVSSGNSLASINPSIYPSIKLRASLATDDPSRSPEIDAWGVRWLIGSRLYLPIILR